MSDNKITERQVNTALKVIKNCSENDLFMLTFEAMKRAAIVGKSHEIYCLLDSEYCDEFNAWERHFLTGDE